MLEYSMPRQEEIASIMWYLGDVTSNYEVEIVPNE